MPSFMEGFASSFGRQMELGQVERAQKKRDAFQMAYDKYVKDRAAYDKAKTDDTQAVNSAKAITASVPNAPESAWEHVYSWLNAGYTPAQAEEKLRTTQFASQEQPAMSDTAQPDTAQVVDPVQKPTVETQTEASGLAPGQEQTAAQQNPDIMGSLFGADGLLNPEAIQQRRMESAQNEVMKGVGVSQDEFNQVTTGYKPAPMSGNAPAITGTIPDGGTLDPNDAVWLEVNGKWQQGYVSPNGATDLSGQPVEATSVRTNEQFTQIRNILSSIPKAEELTQQKADTINLVENVTMLSDMAQANPNVLTRAVGLSVGLNEITNEVNSVISQIEALSAQGVAVPDNAFEEQENQAIATLEQALIAEGTNPSDAQRYAALAIGVKFDLARAMSGPGVLSEADRQAGEQALSTNDPAIFLQIAQDLAKKSMRSTNVLAASIAGSPQAKSAMSIQGVDLGTLFEPVETGLSPEANAWLQNSPLNPNAGKTTQQEGVDGPQGQVKETGQITRDQALEWGLSEDMIGKQYRLFENGIDIIE